MTSPLDNGNRWAVLGVALFMAGCIAIVDRAPALALVNESPSLPKGVYLRVWGAAPGRGAIVAIPQPGVARAYLSALGMPARTLLLKRVSAGSGDRVCASDDEVSTPLGQIRARPVDRRGAALPRWTGCRPLSAAELFLIGDTEGSFDSRYFGPVDRSAVQGVYREWITW